MPQQPKFLQLPLAGKIFLGLLAVTYAGYLVMVLHFPQSLFTSSSETIVNHVVSTSPDAVMKHWTKAKMRNAINADHINGSASSLTQSSIDTPKKAEQQQGQPPQSGETSYPLSTVGKVFFSTGNYDAVCSGAALVSSNRSVVDTAGHCLYWDGVWSTNVIFCPLYDHGESPYGCWAARAVEVPADWVNARPNDLHHDFGMAIVAANAQGLLTDMVGGAGWAYNQPVNQAFYAYGYPAAYPFDGQSRKSCEASQAKSWNHAGGSVISIPCDMTGGSSGGPWYIKKNGNWYVNGHNDFTSSIQPDHMFSPYYDDIWYAMYTKAQEA
jgi:V8-like Glu-specific endopeptidase